MNYAALWHETYQRITLPSATRLPPCQSSSSSSSSSFIVPSADEAVAKKAPISRSERVAKDILAGTMGGIVVTLSGHPFDTVSGRRGRDQRVVFLLDDTVHGWVDGSKGFARSGGGLMNEMMMMALSMER